MHLIAQTFGSWEMWEKHGFPGLVTLAVLIFLFFIVKYAVNETKEVRQDSKDLLKLHSDERATWREEDLKSREQMTEAFQKITDQHTRAVSEMSAEIRNLSEKVIGEIHGRSST